MNHQLLTISPVDFAFDLTIKSTCILGGVITTLYVLKRVSAATRHRAWGLTLVGLIGIVPLSLLLPKTLAISTPDWISTNAVEPLAAADPPANQVNNPPFALLPRNEANFSDAPDEKSQTASPNSVSNSLTSASWLLAVAWLTGATSVLLIELRRTRQVNQLVAQSGSAPDNLQREFSSELNNVPVPMNVALRVGTEGYPPFTAGIVKHFIVMPSSAETWDKNLLTSVLQHELAHIRRRDLAWQMVARLACVVYWFHPLIWYGRKQMYLQSECATDDMVTNNGPSASTYATHLLHIATTYAGKTIPSITAMATPQNLESRIRLLLNDSRSHGQTSRSAGRRLLLLFAGLMMGVSMSTFSISANAEQQQQPKPTTENRVSPTKKTRAEVPQAFRPKFLGRDNFSRRLARGSFADTAKLSVELEGRVNIELFTVGPDGDQRVVGIQTLIRDGACGTTLLAPEKGWPLGHARLRFQLEGMKTVEHVEEIFFCSHDEIDSETPTLKPYVPLTESNLRHFDVSQPRASANHSTQLDLVKGETVILSGKFNAGNVPITHPDRQGPKLIAKLTEVRVADGQNYPVIMQSATLTTIPSGEDEYWFEFPLLVKSLRPETANQTLTIRFTHQDGANMSWKIPVHITSPPPK